MKNIIRTAHFLFYTSFFYIFIGINTLFSQIISSDILDQIDRVQNLSNSVESNLYSSENNEASQIEEIEDDQNPNQALEIEKIDPLISLSRGHLYLESLNLYPECNNFWTIRYS